MKKKVILITGILSILVISSVSSQTIQMIKTKNYDFTQPQYIEDKIVNAKYQEIIINAAAESDSFPISSSIQGSVFTKIFNEATVRTKVRLNLKYFPDTYEKVTKNFENGIFKDVNAVFGVYYKKEKYSHVHYIYPAFFENNMHIITSKQNKIDVKTKSDLKNYKGIYISTDKISDLVYEEFKAMEIQEVDTFYDAYEALLTGKADYVVAGYYPAMIAVYNLGLKDYVAFSSGPVWKIPLFIKVSPTLRRKLEIVEFSKFLKGERYKQAKEEALSELMNIYKENTRGVVPPTFVKPAEQETEDKTAEIKQ